MVRPKKFFGFMTTPIVEFQQDKPVCPLCFHVKITVCILTL